MLMLVVLSLAVYRVTRFAIRDTLIATPRIWLFQVLLGKTGAWRKYLYELLNCPYCLSIWFAGLAVIIAAGYDTVPMPVFMWLAVSAGSLAVWNYIEE